MLHPDWNVFLHYFKPCWIHNTGTRYTTAVTHLLIHMWRVVCKSMSLRLTRSGWECEHSYDAWAGVTSASGARNSSGIRAALLHWHTYTLHFSLYTLAFTPGTRCGNSVTGCPPSSPRPAPHPRRWIINRKVECSSSPARGSLGPLTCVTQPSLHKCVIKHGSSRQNIVMLYKPRIINDKQMYC